MANDRQELWNDETAAASIAGWECLTVAVDNLLSRELIEVLEDTKPRQPTTIC